MSSRSSSTAPAGVRKAKHDPGDGLAGGLADGERVGRALEAVAVDAPAELVGVVGGGGLVVDDDHAVGGAVEQVDVALEQAAAGVGVQA